MPDTMVLLQLDHRNIAKLLGFVHQQAANLARGAAVNYGLLASAFAYLSGYPDQCHHPKEELVYRKLLSRQPDLASSLRDLVAEHAKLTGLTRDLSRAVDRARQDPGAAHENLADQLGEFLYFYRHHMATEEEHFFPAALKTLSSDDWDDIDFALFEKTDPLFDREAESAFAELRTEIMRLGAVEKTATGWREEAAELVALNDLAAFNDAMQRYGEPLQLTRSAQGGYQLERRGSVLAHIPECSESRAAWCAYFFWKGMTQIHR